MCHTLTVSAAMSHTDSQPPLTDCSDGESSWHLWRCPVVENTLFSLTGQIAMTSERDELIQVEVDVERRHGAVCCLNPDVRGREVLHRVRLGLDVLLACFNFFSLSYD